MLLSEMQRLLRFYCTHLVFFYFSECGTFDSPLHFSRKPRIIGIYETSVYNRRADIATGVDYFFYSDTTRKHYNE